MRNARRMDRGTNRWTDGRMDEQAESSMTTQLFQSWGIIQLEDDSSEIQTTYDSTGL